MRFLNVKINSLRRLKDNTFRLVSKKNKSALCDACLHFNDCKLRTREAKTTCNSFAPVIVFQDAINLDKAKVNTLRIGQAWFNRLRVGEYVGVYDKQTNTLMQAEVSDLYWHDDKALIEDKHGKYNHIGMDAIKDGVTMQSILQRCYGKGFYKNAKGLTAIYLSNLQPYNKDTFL